MSLYIVTEGEATYYTADTAIPTTALGVEWVPVLAASPEEALAAAAALPRGHHGALEGLGRGEGPKELRALAECLA